MSVFHAILPLFCGSTLGDSEPGTKLRAIGFYGEVANIPDTAIERIRSLTLTVTRSWSRNSGPTLDTGSANRRCRPVGAGANRPIFAGITVHLWLRCWSSASMTSQKQAASIFPKDKTTIDEFEGLRWAHGGCVRALNAGAPTWLRIRRGIGDAPPAVVGISSRPGR